MTTWDDVVASALRFPGTVETTSYGTPSLKVGKKLLARLRTDPDALVMKTTDLEEKQALLQGRPELFFTTAHYEGYPAVLIRLEDLDPQLLDELMEDAWRTYALRKHLLQREAPDA